jgi:hypothetical protein
LDLFVRYLSVFYHMVTQGTFRILTSSNFT